MTQQIEAAAAVHHALDCLQPADLPSTGPVLHGSDRAARTAARSRFKPLAKPVKAVPSAVNSKRCFQATAGSACRA